MHAVVVLLPGVTSAAMLCSLKMVLWFLRGRSAALIMQFCQPTSRVCSDTRRVVTKKMRLLQEDTMKVSSQEIALSLLHTWDSGLRKYCFCAVMDELVQIGCDIPLSMSSAIQPPCSSFTQEKVGKNVHHRFMQRSFVVLHA